MSTTYETIPQNGLVITKEISGVEEGYYQTIGYLLDNLSKKSIENDVEYRRTRYVISNYIYLIYERLHKNKVREIDYDEVRSWASKNKILASKLIKESWSGFPMEAFEKWVSPQSDLIACGMYRSSNQFTKNTYH